MTQRQPTKAGRRSIHSSINTLAPFIDARRARRGAAPLRSHGAARRLDCRPTRRQRDAQGMDFHISAQQREMVTSVRELAQSEFKPAAQRWMDGTFPWENMRKLAALGVLGMSVPEEYGGPGLPILDPALILEEIAQGCYVTD